MQIAPRNLLYNEITGIVISAAEKTEFVSLFVSIAGTGMSDCLAHSLHLFT